MNVRCSALGGLSGGHWGLFLRLKRTGLTEMPDMIEIPDKGGRVENTLNIAKEGRSN